MHKNDVIKTKESDSSGSRFAAAAYSTELLAYIKEACCNKRGLLQQIKRGLLQQKSPVATKEAYVYAKKDVFI